jgi:MFS family permease
MLVALGSMFFQQTFVSIAKVLPAVVAPMIIVDLHYDPALVGVYFGITSLFALTAQMGCGSFIVRYGPLRMSQVALVGIAIGTMAMAVGWKLTFLMSAIIGGGAAAVSTPTSSQLLGRWSPPRLAPLVFSIKQTAVPAGLLIGGAIGPSLAGAVGWRETVMISAASCFAFVFVLQPLRAKFDAERKPSQAFRISDFATTIKSVFRDPALRNLSLACFAFNGMQQVMTAYFVIYMTHIGYDLVAAGYIFSAAVSIGVPGRILWGWLGSYHVAPRVVMAGLAVGIAISGLLTGLFTSSWPLVGIGAVTAVLSASAMSWHGILLAETARLAPQGRAGAVTGGVL